MPKTIYKVLDVREYQKTKKIQFMPNGLTKMCEVPVHETLHQVVIAEDLATHVRTRFDFFPHYCFEFGGETRYGGYGGDYHLLVPGDHFSINRGAYDRVEILDLVRPDSSKAE